MTDVSTTPSTPSSYEGVSNPPDSGAVSSVDTPQDQMQTPQASSSASADSQGQPGQSQQTQQPQQPQDQQNQPGQQGTQGQQPDLSKPQGPAQPPAAPKTPDASQHPAVQRASLLHTIAQTLAGGPRFKESIDVNTGEMTRQAVPLSRADIGMAIAMEAISGALGGLTQRGPGATGMAAEAGFQKVAQQRQEVQQQQDAQANADFARHYQVLETNMRLHQNAMSLGRQDYEMNQSYVGAFKDLADRIQGEHPDVVKGIVSENDLSKYHVTKDSAIPYGVVKRIDPKTGQQVMDQYGQPQWDLQYMVVDPNFKVDNVLSDEDRAAAKKFNIPGLSSSNLPQNFAMSMRMALNYKARLSALEIADKNLQKYYTTLNSGQQGPAAPTQTPELKDKGVQGLIDAAATKYNVPQALARAVALQESHGNVGTAPSSKGAIGVMQLMPDTAAQLRVDPNNPQQNIDGGVRYLGQLLNQYHGDIKLALAAYNAGPGNVSNAVPNFKETQNYVKSISDAIGLQAQAPAEQVKGVDLAKAIQKDPTLVNAVQLFQGMLNKADGNMGKALAMLQDANSDAAGKIQQLYGDADQMRKYDQVKSIEADRMKRQEQNEEAISKFRSEQQIKAGTDLESTEAMQKILTPPDNFKFTDDMTHLPMPELEQKLKGMGVQVPLNFPNLYAVGHYDAGSPDYANRIWRKGDPTGMSRSDASTFISRYINPNYNEGNFDNLKKLQGDFTYGRGEASQIKSVNTLFHHIYDANESVVSLQNSKSPLVNTAMNKIKGSLLGDPAISSMLAAIEPVKHEFMTFLNNGNALTETDKKAGDNILNISLSPAQLQEQFKRFAVTSADRLLETNEKYKNGFGEDFRAAVSPQVLPLLRRMPEVAERLKNLRVGGNLANHDQGKTVAEMLGMSGQGQQQSAQRPNGVPDTARPPQNGEQPMWDQQGRFRGYAIGGKPTWFYNGQ